MSLILYLFALAVASTTPGHGDLQKLVAQMAQAVTLGTHDQIEIVAATSRGKVLVLAWRPARGAEDVGALNAAKATLMCDTLYLRTAMVKRGVEVELRRSPGSEVNHFTADVCAELDRQRRTDKDSVSPSGSKEFEFRGIRTKDTAAMHTSQWGNSMPKRLGCEDHGPSYARFGVNVTSCYFADGTVSGLRMMNLSASFDTNGPLTSISGFADGERFSLLYNAFTLKYGEPSNINAPKYRNMLGEERIFPIANWQFDDGNLQLRHDPKNGGKYVRLEFKTNLEISRQKAWNDRHTLKPKVDF